VLVKWGVSNVGCNCRCFCATAMVALLPSNSCMRVLVYFVHVCVRMCAVE